MRRHRAGFTLIEIIVVLIIISILAWMTAPAMMRAVTPHADEGDAPEGVKVTALGEGDVVTCAGGVDLADGGSSEQARARIIRTDVAARRSLLMVPM